MIIIDYSQIALSNIIAQKMAPDDEMIRHMILNSIRMYNKKFKKEYGQVILACDGSNTWRRSYFPNYKASRRKGRSESTIDWNAIFEILNKVRDEIRDNTQYKVLHFDGCEADDIIGTLALNTQEFGNNEPVMIVSSDHDFIQLQKFGIKQYSPIQKKYVTEKDPNAYLFEHILRGDTGDGIPNVLSGDNVFVDGVRQTPLSKTKINLWAPNALKLNEVMPEDVYRNYQRNKTLIDLTMVPEVHKSKIINTFENYVTPHKTKFLNYLIKNRCKLLIECIEEFY